MTNRLGKKDKIHLVYAALTMARIAIEQGKPKEAVTYARLSIKLFDMIDGDAGIGAESNVLVAQRIVESNGSRVH